jgi:uncharacterized protein (DUF3084 family)
LNKENKKLLKALASVTSSRHMLQNMNIKTKQKLEKSVVQISKLEISIDKYKVMEQNCKELEKENEKLRISLKNSCKDHTKLNSLYKQAKCELEITATDMQTLINNTKKLQCLTKRYNDLIEEKKCLEISVNAMQDDCTKLQALYDDAQKESSQADVRVS